MKRILAVDDDSVMIGFIKNALSSHGYEVTCLTGGKEAIEILKEQTFDCPDHNQDVCKEWQVLLLLFFFLCITKSIMKR